MTNPMPRELAANIIFGIDVTTIPLSNSDFDTANDICAVADWWDKKWAESQLQKMGDYWGSTLAEVRQALELHHEAMREPVSSGQGAFLQWLLPSVGRNRGPEPEL